MPNLHIPAEGTTFGCGIASVSGSTAGATGIPKSTDHVSHPTRESRYHYYRCTVSTASTNCPTYQAATPGNTATGCRSLAPARPLWRNVCLEYLASTSTRRHAATARQYSTTTCKSYEQRSKCHDLYSEGQPICPGSNR